MLLLPPLLSIIYSISECVWVQVSSVTPRCKTTRWTWAALAARRGCAQASAGGDKRRSIDRSSEILWFICMLCCSFIVFCKVVGVCWASMVMVSLVMLGVSTSPFSSISTSSGSCKFQVSIKGTTNLPFCTEQSYLSLVSQHFHALVECTSTPRWDNADTD